MVVAFVGILVVGGVTYGLRTRITSSIHEEAVRDAAVIAENSVTEVLGPQDLTRPFEMLEMEELDEHVQTHVLSQHVKRFKLWNRDGLLVYSNVPQLAGTLSPNQEPFTKALQRVATYGIVSEPESPLEPDLGELIEAYIPILWEPGVAAGVAEVYLPTRPTLPRSTPRPETYFSLPA